MVFSFFFSHAKMPSDINATYIALVPKTDNPESIHHYRPISLCNTSYKIISKILALQLRRILPTLISPMQSAFLPNRRASDNTIIIQEVLHFFKTTKSKTNYMILKLDMEKAFDKLEWSFVKHVLHFYNFPTHMITLIMECISSCCFSILLNG